ncbi:MAG: response regulator [Chthoniobacteraceae bacterium]
MSSDADHQWLQTAANDLNNLLQVISESSKAIQPMCETSPEGMRYFAFLRTSLERAKNVTAQLASRLGGESPVAPAPAPAPAPASQRPSVAIDNPAGTKELILIIDDEALIVTLAKRMLTDAGYRVVTSAEPFQALEIFKQLKDEVDLIILDFTLPIMDGSEVFDALRKIKPSVAVMLSSGFAEQDKVRAMLSQGLRGFLPKPYTQEKLLSQVRSTLDAIRSAKMSERQKNPVA